jgi:hypothetical protein
LSREWQINGATTFKAGDVMDLIKVFLDKDFNVLFQLNKFLILLMIVLSVILFLIFRKKKTINSQVYEIDEAVLGIGDQKIKIRPNFEDAQIAYKLWVELSTRKIGLSIDIENDVIDEVYDSWYEFFKITRELIKEIPIHKIKSKDSTKRLLDIAINVLNDGLRPHLTKWHAKFQKWYRIECEKPENINVTPQELQKKFTDFDVLIEDMKGVNHNLIKYREYMKKIALDD